MQIYISRNGEEYGPYSDVEIRQHLESGELSPSDSGWCEGLPDWQPLSTWYRKPEEPPPSKVMPVQSAPADVQSPKPHRPWRYVLAGLAVLFVLYLASPYYSLGRLRVAFETNDRDRLVSLIDFQAVRESLKDQFRVQGEEKMAKSKRPEGFWESVGNLIAPAVINYAVDCLITPSGLFELISDSKSAFDRPPLDAPKKPKEWPRTLHAGFISPSRFLVELDGGVKLRFQLVGLGWRLERIEIPSESVRQK